MCTQASSTTKCKEMESLGQFEVSRHICLGFVTVHNTQSRYLCVCPTIRPSSLYLWSAFLSQPALCAYGSRASYLAWCQCHYHSHDTRLCFTSHYHHHLYPKDNSVENVAEVCRQAHISLWAERPAKKVKGARTRESVKMLVTQTVLDDKAWEDVFTSAKTTLVSLYNRHSGVDLGFLLFTLALLTNITLADTLGNLEWGPTISTIITTLFVLCLHKLAKTVYNNHFNSTEEAKVPTEGGMLEDFALFCCVQFVVSMDALAVFNAAVAGVILDSGHDKLDSFLEIIIAFAVVNSSAWISSVCVEMLRDSVLDISEQVEDFFTDIPDLSKLIPKDDESEVQRVKQKQGEWKPKYLFQLAIAGIFCLMVFNSRTGLGEKVLLSSNRYTPQKEQNNFSFIYLTLHRDKLKHEQVNIQQDSEHSRVGCSLRWGNLTALDHALLAHMADFQAEAHGNELRVMRTALEFAFPKDQGYNVTVDEDWGKSKRKELSQRDYRFTTYYKIDFNNLQHTVIAVQGTNDLGDVLADIRLWLASGMIDLSQCGAGVQWS